MDRISIKKIPSRLKNGFIGRRVDGSSISYVDLGDVKSNESGAKLLSLMIDKDDPFSWDEFCDMIGDFDPRGKVHIDYLVINGVVKRFH
tara:strand:- start:255 stop:521 length:267 start_codon:yes stop_codon:yes gene_type:complete